MLHNDTVLAGLLAEGRLSEALREGAQLSEAVQELQIILYELGYGRQLRWRNTGPSSFYDRHTRRAVRAFASNNKIPADGSRVDPPLLEAMSLLLDVLDEMQLVYHDLRARQIRQKYFRGSPDRTAVAAMQKLLNRLGYGALMEYETYQNDGIFGAKTVAAVAAFAAHQRVKFDGSVVTIRLARRLIRELAGFFGKDWPTTRRSTLLAEYGNDNIFSDDDDEDDLPPVAINPVSKPATPAQVTPLQIFSGSHITGNTLWAHPDFFPALERINKYAKKAKVLLHITSSFRTSHHVQGAIVPPARMSNHMVGHAIDVNFRYGDGFRQMCNSQCLLRPPLPAPVQDFVNLLKQDKKLRWGGEFPIYDPVHIDDHYNRDTEAWRRKHQQLQEARRLGII